MNKRVCSIVWNDCDRGKTIVLREKSVLDLRGYAVLRGMIVTGEKP